MWDRPHPSNAAAAAIVNDPAGDSLEQAHQAQQAIADRMAGIEEALTVLALNAGLPEIASGLPEIGDTAALSASKLALRVEAEAQSLPGDRLDRAEGEGRR